jgi:hypothetical protein
MLNMDRIQATVALMVIGTFVVLALRGEITGHDVMLIVTSLISFHYGSQTKR